MNDLEFYKAEFYDVQYALQQNQIEKDKLLRKKKFLISKIIELNREDRKPILK